MISISHYSDYDEDFEPTDDEPLFEENLTPQEALSIIKKLNKQAINDQMGDEGYSVTFVFN